MVGRGAGVEFHRVARSGGRVDAFTVRRLKAFRAVKGGFRTNVIVERTSTWNAAPQSRVVAAVGARIRFLPGYPSYSPDLNVIENLFGIVLRKMGAMDVTTPLQGRGEARKQNALSRFRHILQGEVDDGTLTRLSRSMPKRLAKVIEKKGGPTKY